MFETKDPYLLLSLVNTKLRDEYASLDDLCKSNDVDSASIKERLAKVGYTYSKDNNQFINA
ncbi:DUF4250 domain-containing protein [Cellulosilyticum ruminicola]|uniref:DUF4250 domain-containing protein n=1 Tax=Cellulosilyticum ruminicola TaxID=425254 RepID=UPI0006D03160|nr:DUF4250 domain-containing protein [Cellulosilyticum ruminicola]